jgi:hypothetical protein
MIIWSISLWMGEGRGRVLSLSGRGAIPVLWIGVIELGAPAQDLPKFQIPCMTPKSVQTCSIYSPDGDSKVSLKKNDPFMTNGCPIVAPAEVTSD